MLSKRIAACQGQHIDLIVRKLAATRRAPVNAEQGAWDMIFQNPVPS